MVFLDALPWIVIVVSLVIILLSTEIAVNIQLVSEPLFSSSVAKVLIWLILPAALVIILFGARDEKKWGFRLFMGFLNLTIVSGITSFLGDFLSYIRLMALGLVTAGIGTCLLYTSSSKTEAALIIEKAYSDSNKKIKDSKAEVKQMMLDAREKASADALAEKEKLSSDFEDKIEKLKSDSAVKKEKIVSQIINRILE